MNEIVFVRPYLLYVLILLIIFLIVPVIILICKRRMDFRSISSFVLHVFLFTSLALSLAGIQQKTTVPHEQDEVFILADLSFSNANQLESIDKSIKDIQNDLPDDTKIGVIGFAKEAKMIKSFTETFNSVADFEIDNSATDIANALNYAETLFSPNSFKRIILLSDGKQTDGNGVLVAERLIRENVHIDSINFNNEDTSILFSQNSNNEIQINQVTFTPSTFLNHNEEAIVTLQSNFEDKVDLTLYLNDSIYLTGLLNVTSGLNIFRFKLDTTLVGENNYHVSVAAQQDTNELNNSYYFSQNVSDKLSVLVIPNKQSNTSNFLTSLFDEKTSLSIYDYQNEIDLEYLCSYDEIILDNINLDDFTNAEQFVYNLDAISSVYGKSIFTIGEIASKNDDKTLTTRVENILPVRFHPTNQSRVISLVIDCSYSMVGDRLANAKEGAKRCIEQLNSNDYIMIESFCNEVKIVQPLTRLTKKEAIIEAIDSIETDAGTHIGSALATTFEQMKNLDFESKQVILLSDGEPNEGDADPIEAVKTMSSYGIFTSVINISSIEGTNLMNNIATQGNGSYYFVNNAEDIASIMVNAIEEEFIKQEVDIPSEVIIDNKEHEVMQNIESLPSVNGYYFSRSKGSAQMIASFDFVSENGGKRKCPLFATWNYGRGKVSSFTSEFNNWALTWQASDVAKQFLSNISNYLIPTERKTTSFNIYKIPNGHTTTIRVGVIETLNNAILTATVKNPNGETQTQNLSLNQSLYEGDFESVIPGKYSIELVYKNEEKEFKVVDYFDFSYSSEYNSFDSRKESLLYQLCSDSGEVYSKNDKIKTISHQDRIVTKDYSLYFIIFAIFLFVVDIAFRKVNIKRRKK